MAASKGNEVHNRGHLTLDREDFLDANGKWQCIRCGSCCRLGALPQSVIDLLQIEAMIGPDGWCRHYDHDLPGCSIYEDRPSLCRDLLLPDGVRATACADVHQLAIKFAEREELKLNRRGSMSEGSREFNPLSPSQPPDTQLRNNALNAAQQAQKDKIAGRAEIAEAAAQAVSSMVGTVIAEATKFARIDDSMSAAVINRSRRNWVKKQGTGQPIRGQWIAAPDNLKSMQSIIDEHGVRSVEDVHAVLEAFEGKGMGIAPWTSCTLAHAGGGWGPASIICYQDPVDQMTITLLMIIRPGFNYCAGVSLSRMWIGNKADGQGWEMLNHIENIHTNLCQFSEGVRKSVSWNGVKVTWQPAKTMTFTIEDA